MHGSLVLLMFQIGISSGSLSEVYHLESLAPQKLFFIIDI